jgi:rhodanese-related sulfurtransferase
MMRNAIRYLMGIPAFLAAGLLPASGLTVAGLQEQLTAGAKITVVDIRSPRVFSQDHIPGAINIPASLCPYKNLPPLGDVVIYGEGLGGDDIVAAAAALAAKPGLKVNVLDGGYAAWKSSAGLTTRGPGLKRESLNYISYAHLKGLKPGSAVLLDLRKGPARDAQSLTDLNVEFPGMRRTVSRAEAAQAVAGAAPVIVLIDDGDGTAEAEARKLKAGGTHGYVILAGGEPILARHGQAGLQRNAAQSFVVGNKPKPPASAP